MILHLYRIEYNDQITYAILNAGRFFFVDPRNPQMPLDPQRSCAIEQCKILNPTQPSKIVGIGLNYKDHAEERKKPLPPEPLLFLKPPSALIAPGEEIVLPEASRRIDPEGELAVVIGKVARKLGSLTEAAQCIFGYSCFNDVTARDLQDQDVQFTRAKG